MMLSRINRLKKHHKVMFAIITGFGVVAFWRGAWNLMDLYLFPGQLEVSAWASFAIGLGTLYVTHTLIKVLT